MTAVAPPLSSPKHVAALDLEAHAPLRMLRRDWLEDLSDAAELVRCAAGTVLATEGQAAPALSIVHSGNVGFAAGKPAGALSLETVPPARRGTMIGAGAVSGAPEDDTCVALDEVELITWQAGALARLCTKRPGLREQLVSRASIRPRLHELESTLHRSLVFASVSASLVRWLVESATLVPFAPGAHVCEEGAESDGMFVIIRGEVAIEQRHASASRHLATLRRGDCFGEKGLVERRPRSATAVALTPCEVLVFGRAEFEALSRESAAARRTMTSLAAERSSDPAPRAPELVVLVDRSSRPDGELAGLVAEVLRAMGDRVEIAPAISRDTLDRSPAEYVIAHIRGADEARSLAEVANRACVGILVEEGAGGRPVRWPAATRNVHRVTLAAAPSLRPTSGLRMRLELPAGAPAALDRLAPSSRAALERLGRAITRRLVGVALGGGAAWGYGHCALLRGLHRAQVPVDIVAGVSFGSIAGAFYASRRLDGLDELVEHRRDLGATALACVVSTRPAASFIHRHVRERTIEELAVPYLAVAVDARRGVECVFRDGDIGQAVRASCSFPGVFATTSIHGVRYVDACVKNNVPASWLVDAGADFIIASNIVPPPRLEKPAQRPSRLAELASELGPFQRVRDTVRSMYILVNDTGRRQAACAAATFTPDLSAFLPTDFGKASDIIARAEQDLEPFLASTREQYHACVARAGAA